MALTPDALTRRGRWLARLWRTSPPLTATGLLMLPILAAAVAGLWLDPRTITGAPAWLKPAKFAASIAIYTMTLAWVFTYLPAWVKTRRIAGWATAATLVLEIAVIGVQAWRGTASHFNVATPLDTALFGVMGVAIVAQTLASVAVAVALWRQSFHAPANGWALRLGLTMSIVGAAGGGLMTRPTEAQLQDARTARLTVAGAHTVGAPDGGPGLPLTGWSVEHGDLRVAHFLGLHAMQLLPLLAFATPTRWSDARRTRLVKIAAASYMGLFVILVWQALRGESVVAPTPLTIAVLGLWAVATTIGVWTAASREARAYTPATV